MGSDPKGSDPGWQCGLAGEKKAPTFTRGAFFFGPNLMPYKIPESVLVVIHTADLQVLLIERADKPGYWPVSYTHLTLPTICSV